MPDNLTVSIGIDTKKLQADLAVTKQQMTQAGKDFQRAINSGAGAEQIDKLSGAYDTLRKQYAATAAKSDGKAITKQLREWDD